MVQALTDRTARLHDKKDKGNIILRHPNVYVFYVWAGKAACGFVVAASVCILDAYVVVFLLIIRIYEYLWEHEVRLKFSYRALHSNVLDVLF